MLFNSKYLITRFIKIFFLFIFIFAVLRFSYYTCTEGFSLKRIENTIFERADLVQKAPSSRELKKMQDISQKPYSYLKKGSQSYAFINKNNNFILKLYKCHHLQPADWLMDVPLPDFIKPWRDTLIERRKYKLNLTISSFAIARDTLHRECGILYAQVLPTHSYSLPITLVDAMGRTYNVDLAKYGFALQRKACLIFPTLQEWIKKEEIGTAKKALTSLVGLVAQRSKKGIEDADPDLHKNAGFVGTTAIFIDIGSFRQNQNIANHQQMKKDMEKIFKNLLEWLNEKSSLLHNHVLSLLDQPWNVSWVPLSSEE